jgi:hypothetical protein
VCDSWPLTVAVHTTCSEPARSPESAYSFIVPAQKSPAERSRACGLPVGALSTMVDDPPRSTRRIVRPSLGLA